MSIGDGSETIRIQLSDQTGEGIRVAVIDTGVDPLHPSLGPAPVSAGIRLSLSKDGTVVELPEYDDDFGHGTACAAIIRRIAPRCTLLAVKISSGVDPIPPSLVTAGIGWAVENGADVISISAGTQTSEGEALFSDCCCMAVAAGVVVVVAESSDGGTTYPAALESVIAVKGEAAERNWYTYRCDPRSRRRFMAYGSYQRVAWLGGRYLFLSGTSLAAARLSGIVALILQRFGRMPWDRLLDILRVNATNSASVELQSVTSLDAPQAPPRAVDWIRKAAIYPFSKEMHSLVRFRHLLPFELVAVADPTGRGCFGRDAGEVIGCERTGLTITANLDEAIRDADTLIMGFTGRLGALLHQNTGDQIAQQVIASGKNLYSFEPFEHPRYRDLTLAAARRGVRIAWPSVGEADLEDLVRANETPASYSRTPILAVVGTSSSQGKFTLQLLLRERLMAEGLRVGQVGTEHQSLLFGMDDCFPVGHVPNVRLRTDDWNEYFDLRYQQIQRDKDPDIILVGTQGGILPCGTARPIDDSVNPYNIFFLWPIRADSFILVVNHLDDDRFIQDTIDVLRIVGKGRTILLALSTRRKKIVRSFGRRIVSSKEIGQDEQAEHLRRLEGRFGIPAISILDKRDARRLVDIVLNAYSPTNRTHVDDAR